ncbi:MAG: hypothetical protein ACKVRN_11970 [Pyrinomonadaceae bacterium]
MRIDTIAGLIAVLTLQKANLATYFTQCNATAADVTEITNDLNNLNALLAFGEVVEGYKEGFFEIKQLIFNGAIGTPIPAWPPALVPPTLVAALAGALKRAQNRNRRFKAGPGYTDAIGDLLGIGPDDPTTGTPPTQPTISVEAAQSGYVFSVVVSNRTDSDRWELLVRPVGSTGAWVSMGSRTTKSSDFTYNPGAGATDNPVQLEVRVQLKKSDANFADPSDIKLVTVNP